MKLTIQVPGKLMIGGEWSVLESGHTALVGAFDRYAYCELEEAEGMTVHLPDLKIDAITGEYIEGSFRWQTDDPDQQEKTRFARSAIEHSLRFLEAIDRKPTGFDLLTDTIELTLTLKDGSIAKVGLGASAAVTVSIIGAFLKQAGFNLELKETQDLIFRLSVIAHFRAQGKAGSGFDIAASTYGGVLKYQRFDPDWLASQLQDMPLPMELLDGEWPGLLIEPVTLPDKMEITAAFSGQSASTAELLPQLAAFKQSLPEVYRELMGMIDQTVLKLLEAIKQNQPDFIINLIEANRLLLSELSKLSGVELETELLKKLVDVAEDQGGAAKFSGAGGGDSGIAVCFDRFVREDIEWAWEDAGLYPLDVFVAKKGVNIWR